MSLTDWFKRLFAAPPATGDDPETVRGEYGVGGYAGLAQVEDARAREKALEADEPSDLAP